MYGGDSFRVGKRAHLTTSESAPAKCSPTKIMGAVAAIALIILCIGGISTCVAAVYFVPQSFLTPLLVVGGGTAGGSFIGILVLAGLALMSREEENLVYQEQFEWPTLVPKPPSGLPGNFLEKNDLRAICWANAMLQAFRHLHNQLSFIDKDLVTSDVKYIIECVEKLEAKVPVTKQDMKSLIVAIRENYKAEAGFKNVDGNEVFGHYLRVIFGQRGHELIQTPWFTGQTLPVTCQQGVKPATLTAAFGQAVGPHRIRAQEGQLPQMLILEDHTHKHGALTGLKPEKDGYYHCDIPTGDEETALYGQYMLVGTLDFHRAHYTFSKRVDDSHYCIYNDKIADFKSDPLKIEKTATFAFFQLIED